MASAPHRRDRRRRHSYDLPVLASQSVYAYTGVGTPLYFSPELCNEEPYNQKSDIWAFGCLVYELAALEPPFIASNQIALAKLRCARCSRRRG